ncbi:MAG TPA: SMC-Scp complex subunit ScpB [Acidimicrobiales bacterium]|nr:SMC-Scp complex subunit ScpB [Acidimicrobiales bacterium]
MSANEPGLTPETGMEDLPEDGPGRTHGDGPEVLAGDSPPSEVASQVQSRAESAAIEAVLTVATEPVPPGLLAELLELPVEEVEELCRHLAASYEADGRGFALARVAGGYRFQSSEAYAAYVERFVLDGGPQKLSPAALETLAVVAYKQPISRSQVAAIRGVNVESVMRMLVARGYVQAVGRDEGPGQPILFGTTSMFLERLGLDSIEDLPPLAAFVPPASTVEMLEKVLRSESVE